MKITVFGASGGVGTQLVKQALETGHQVRAIYRSKPAPPLAPSHEVVTFNAFHDATELRNVVAGSDAVVSCLGQRRSVPRNPWSRILTPKDFMENFATAMVEALSAAEAPRRFVAVSAAGVGSSESAMHPLIRFVFGRSNIGVAYRDLAKMEARLESSNLDWTAVRPVTLTPGRLTRKARVCDRYGLMHMISRADVAHYLLRCVENPGFAPVRSPMIRA